MAQSVAPPSDDDEPLGYGEVVGPPASFDTLLHSVPQLLRMLSLAPLIRWAAPRLLRVLDVARSMHWHSGAVAIKAGILSRP